MLSRIAESFFWLGRYLERAEATTRMLAEHHQLIVEDQSVTEDIASAVLLDALSTPHSQVRTAAALVQSVVGSDLLPSTIIGSVAAARDNARAIRDSLSGDTFEALNSAYLEITRMAGSHDSPGIVLYRALDRLLVINGVVEWTMPRDEAYRFLGLGQEIERIDMIGRLLAVRHDQLWPTAGPLATLRSAGALSAFLRTGSPISADEVRRFLVLDGTFPRSMRSCATDAEDAVRGLSRLGIDGGDSLLREVGMLRSALEYAADSSPAGVDRLARQARTAAVRASDEVNRAFFRQHGTIVWSH